MTEGPRLSRPSGRVAAPQPQRASVRARSHRNGPLSALRARTQPPRKPDLLRERTATEG
jgi:hypothetical protein